MNVLLATAESQFVKHVRRSSLKEHFKALTLVKIVMKNPG